MQASSDKFVRVSIDGKWHQIPVDIANDRRQVLNYAEQYKHARVAAAVEQTLLEDRFTVNRAASQAKAESIQREEESSQAEEKKDEDTKKREASSRKEEEVDRDE
jgi:hypothetical protein